jgi:hypothetical protein
MPEEVTPMRGAFRAFQPGDFLPARPSAWVAVTGYRCTPLSFASAQSLSPWKKNVNVEERMISVTIGAG